MRQNIPADDDVTALLAALTKSIPNVGTSAHFGKPQTKSRSTSSLLLLCPAVRTIPAHFAIKNTLLVFCEETELFNACFFIFWYNLHAAGTEKLAPSLPTLVSYDRIIDNTVLPVDSGWHRSGFQGFGSTANPTSTSLLCLEEA